LKKIRGVFLTQKKADSAIEKINSYCGNVKIIYDYSNGGYYDYDNYLPDDSYNYIPDPNVMSLGGFGSFGMTSNWNFSPYIAENKYGRTFMRFSPFYPSAYNPSERVILEADVSDEYCEYVRDKLYSLGAITVT